MPHADASIIPSYVRTKGDLWEHIYVQLEALLEGQRNWVTNCANASSLIYSSLLDFPQSFGQGGKAVNWCGFYIDSMFFPVPRLSGGAMAIDIGKSRNNVLLLGPFCGKPACQLINVSPGKARGVCADAFLQKRTLVVADVEAYPGHIACDGETKSEIVIPLLVGGDGIGVLDLDCLAHEGFDDTDRVGLEKIAKLVVDSCDW